MLSHSPLRMFTEYHDKCVLLSGQGPIEQIAKRIGFTNTVTINDIRSAYPFLDMVSHTPKPAKVRILLNKHILFLINVVAVEKNTKVVIIQLYIPSMDGCTSFSRF